jgi:hypothetical protein
MNIIRLKNILCISFDKGEVYYTDKCTDELYNEYCNTPEKELYQKLFPKDGLADYIDKKSEILERRGTLVVIPSISEVSLPEDLVQAIVKAEKDNNKKEINKYLNFWRLVSLNPDDRVRNNIYWFMKKWDVEMTNNGMLVGYRNVTIKEKGLISTPVAKEIITNYFNIKINLQKNPEDFYVEIKNNCVTLHTEERKDLLTLEDWYEEIMCDKIHTDTYTDVHSHSTTIKIGQPVRMPRESCDTIQENSCSRGLHLGGKAWIKRNYFGEVGIQCLVNPANIVAVPTIDNYGKLRCCEYFPVAFVEYDEYGDIIDKGFPADYETEAITESLYQGLINNDDFNKYAVCGSADSREDIYNSYLKHFSK